MKYLFTFLAVIMLASCEKEYNCVCTSHYTGNDTLVDHIKTTKLGSKGYKSTCTEKENAVLSNCRLK